MNIFFLSWNVKECAELYCDQHVNKILLEIVQMLYTTWHYLGEEGWNKSAPFKKNSTQRGYNSVSNKKHPMVMWVRSHKNNYIWTALLGVALSLEFEKRFKKIHSSTIHLLWLYENIPKNFIEIRNENAFYSKCGFPKFVTPVPECMPKQYQCSNLIIANVNNYLNEKIIFGKYKQYASFKT